MKRNRLKTMFHAAFAFCMLAGTTVNLQAAEQPGTPILTTDTATLHMPVEINKDIETVRIYPSGAMTSTKVSKYEKGTLLAFEADGAAKVRLSDNEDVYVKADCLAITKEQKEALAKEQQEELEKQKKVEEAKAKVEEAKKMGEITAANNTFSDELEEEDLELAVDGYSWNGSVLTPSAGVNQGPSGKETYYNLPMEGVVSIMRSIGNNDEYWVREDGVKMLGNYVMVAAHLPTRPRGSLVPTSLGMGIVCDTGTFALNNHTQLDIAVAW